MHWKIIILLQYKSVNITYKLHLLSINYVLLYYRIILSEDSFVLVTNTSSSPKHECEIRISNGFGSRWPWSSHEKDETEEGRKRVGREERPQAIKTFAPR